MKRKVTLLAIPVIALAALSACTTPSRVSPVEVTRFTGATPAELGTGTIRIEAGTSLDSESLEYGTYEAQLAQELRSLGYSVVDQSARQVAVLNVARVVTSEPRRSPVTVGGGAGVGSYGSGVGLGIGLDLSGSDPDLIYTEVSVAIRPANGGGNLWEGRSNFTATENSDFADPALAAERAISALFAGFPGRSGETIIVE